MLESAWLDVLARPSRLAALDSIGDCDTAAHVTFDRLSRLATQLLRVPTSLVSLIDAQGQRFAGQVGLPSPWAERRTTPLSHSLCQHVVVADAPLVIADARADPLAHTSLAIPDLGVIAYLGVPLHSAEGEVLGALCAIDHAPRAWSHDDIETLTNLAYSVSGELQLRQAVRAQQETQIRLEVSEQRQRLVVEHTEAAFWISSPDGRTIHYISPSYERLWGRPLELLEANPLAFLEAIHPDDRDQVRTAIVGSRPTGSDLTYRLVRPDGTVVWVRDRAIPVADANGVIERLVGIITDISHERLMAEALRASEAQYRLLFDDHPQPMWVFEQGTHAFLTVNQAAIQRYGYSREEFLAMTIRDIRPPEDVPALLALANQEHQPGVTHLPGVWRHRSRDGAVFEVEVTLHPLPFHGRPAALVMAQDVTERRRLEAQLQQAQKLESLGRLAGGVAHDFNNLLTVIGGYAELLSLDLPAGHTGHTEANAIIEATQRARALTGQLLAFARRQPVTPKLVNLNQLVEESGSMLRMLVGKHLTLKVATDPALRPVLLDPGQFGQVLMNLVVNARDAMPDEGTITITTTQLDERTGSGQRRTGLLGPHALMTIRDSGTGMTPEVLKQVFEPFFTTKPTGKGTGLGLAVVHGIVTQAGGQVWAASELGRGTTVTIALPQTHPLEASSSTSSTPAPVSGGSETLLLVEDDPHVQRFAEQVLRNYGYRVRTAVDGADALRQAQAKSGPLHLLVTNMDLPQQSGQALAAQLQTFHPDLRTLFISGDVAAAEGVPLPAALLPKPFTPLSLARAVRSVLDATT